jgi:shikimate kinase
MKNIILIGMSGAGKSTLGILLAKALNYDFMDTDVLIQQQEGQLLQDILQEKGIERFKTIEEKVICQLNTLNTIIATGGSVVYSNKGMKHLKEQGTIVYIAVDFEEIQKRVKNIHTRGIVMGPDQSLQDVYLERVMLYEKYADISVNIKQETIEETVSLLVELLEKEGEQ